MKKNAIFIDRDGVINKLIIVNNKETSPKNFNQFSLNKNAKLAIKILKKNFLTIVITNQPDISRKLMSKDELHKMHNYILKKLLVDDIFACLHDDNDNCNCRKPLPGMILKAEEKWNLNLKKSITVGDSWRDINAGKSAGTKTCYINKKNERRQEINFDFEAPDILSAAKIIDKNYIES
ncbi:MAG: D-glycero-beta-D-manno-heptose-1,7-bisphosphate 7-phosphatase [Alphaproteobacteria bacterium MarineAlpha5_Bin11]|nr:histidinol phosphate phosphatase [Pelagibacteraceae bacterium]PPR43283.1 MAG: D-glycero-beta-D-manno-heptose-1,7-bisphosphate 7-phosphatase [Alphaproteobacteria bacterium MarineAlpha5_Bin11]PPR51279.1 MAG: D-glycero-beta-D-manno-heptose-1,7-bisphosphate 7-phosphatase [Alphaproteobacteria bacterium MarineAlpha5_Bin10]|tara:strand:+ start:22295 stop:22831 length:537 start_codon:yes stop_codon:yes gene_type:complete